ncbi:hypothetical protein S40293_10310 [Stachybotrys chartarum IBT 40293]|nr:hypothetical protein S40293_10310 [Stachybotrys chartarum IBT 40293]
MAPVYTGRQGA